MRLQIYEDKRSENAFDIIYTSFAYGAKLKRNPISDEERKLTKQLKDEEEARFDVYKRAWYLRCKKSKSIGGTCVPEKGAFILNWDERIAMLAKAAQEKRDELLRR